MRQARISGSKTAIYLWVTKKCIEMAGDIFKSRKIHYNLTTHAGTGFELLHV